MSKLENIGLSSCLTAMFRSYLACRTKFVQCHGHRSASYAQTSGVPQSSILGPLMFAIFINDIATTLEVRFLLYADNLKIFCEIDSFHDCTRLQRNLNLINFWCIDNHLPLNFNKCNEMPYCCKNDPLIYVYAPDGAILNRPDLIVDLGITFDSKLSFNYHIVATVAPAYKSLGFIIRNMKDFKSFHTLRLLFITFVKSKLEYGSVVWSPIYFVHIASIEKVQRRFF